MQKYKIGFIGYGNMAKAISKSLAKCDFVENLYASDVNEGAKDDNVTFLQDNGSVIESCSHVFLSVKPQMANEALRGLDFEDKVVISIMAGKDLDSLTELCRGAKKIVRVMPNLCARVGKSVNAYCAIGLDDNELAVAQKILSSFGLAMRLSESFFDVITGLTGSSPAYTFKYAKAITECGVRYGLDFEKSRDLALYSISACMDVLKNAQSLEEMQTTIENVCSKGGTTIEGIYKLNEGNFDELVISAIGAAIQKSAELAK